MRLIRNAFALLPLLLLLAFGPPSPTVGEPGTAAVGPDNYFTWNLQASGLSQEAFACAVKGYHFLQQKNMLAKTDLLTIIDYSKPSSQKRLYVLDMRTGKILFNTLVAHGRNSGYNYATDFSNDEASLKSSLGFYITLGTYNGANGYSLQLSGCEKGINDKAFNRAIVFHGAGYVSESFIHNTGCLGRSYGCPAVPVAISKKIIDKIKNGSCMFLYHPAKKYLLHSKILGS